MADTYTILLSGYIKKEPGDGTQTIIPPGTPAYATYQAWVAAGGVPQQEAAETYEQVTARLHAENYELAKAKFSGLAAEYHSLESIEWKDLEAECRVYDANPIPANIGPTMQGELYACELIGHTCEPEELVQRVLPKADALRAARFAIIAKRNKNRAEINALPDLNNALAYNLQYDGLGF